MTSLVFYFLQLCIPFFIYPKALKSSLYFPSHHFSIYLINTSSPPQCSHSMLHPTFPLIQPVTFPITISIVRSKPSLRFSHLFALACSFSLFSQKPTSLVRVICLKISTLRIPNWQRNGHATLLILMKHQPSYQEKCLSKVSQSNALRFL